VVRSGSFASLIAVSNATQLRATPGVQEPQIFEKLMVNGENRLEQIVGMALLLLLVIGCFVVLRPFVSALLLALILSYATWPIYVWNERMLKGRKGAAATLMTIMVAAILLVPLIVLGSSLADQVYQARAWIRGLLSEGPPEPPHWVADIPLVGAQAYQYWAGLAHNTEN